MVKIINYKERESEEGNVFFVLELQGGIEMVKSQTTQRYYVTAKKATIPSTFDGDTCKSLIGTEMPGKIAKVETEPYEYTIKETGEVIELNFRYEYCPDESPEVHNVEKSSSTIEDFMGAKTQEKFFSENGVS